ncbi:hypothetical protein K402DRAFT_232703 [Aulographum hederae CBS 113979]|uniref:Uncharacterized protein n=1 Tax=Aulographum hederae CBS 113979 TaxID=1176131 RepID=A0A6G1GL09_9PEZI|nr:hypothetical protein K402DRAFT_232703 [Aulographum hederae CBS 113979]
MSLRLFSGVEGAIMVEYGVKMCSFWKSVDRAQSILTTVTTLLIPSSAFGTPRQIHHTLRYNIHIFALSKTSLFPLRYCTPNVTTQYPRSLATITPNTPTLCQPVQYVSAATSDAPDRCNSKNEHTTLVTISVSLGELRIYTWTLPSKPRMSCRWVLARSTKYCLRRTRYGVWSRESMTPFHVSDPWALG